VRWSAVIGALAGFALLAAFFVDWFVVTDAEAAEALRREVESHTTGDDSPGAVAWRQRAQELVERGSVTGLDFYSWSRTAPGYERKAHGTPEGPVDRAIFVVGLAALALPIGGGILGLYFVTHRFRRARSPILILAMLLGLVAVAIPAAYKFGEGIVGRVTDAAVGARALSALGGVLLLVGSFGVRAENWWRVFAGAAATGGALGLVGWAYVRWGILG
jgi:hypothetical protein